MSYLHVSHSYKVLAAQNDGTESVRYVLEGGSVHLFTVLEVVLGEVGGPVVVILAADHHATSG